MNIFTLNKTTYSNGKAINGLKTISWVERFQEAGEFTLTGKPTQQLMSDLPLGSLISHDKTLEVMVVENHEIEHNAEGEDILTISGRSADAYLFDNRITATTWDENGDYYDYIMVFEFTPWDYVLPYARPWSHIVRLINKHAVNYDLYSGEVNKSEWEIPNAAVVNLVSTSDYGPDEIVPIAEERTPSLSTVYQEILSLLSFADIGLKIERPNPTRSTLTFIVHRGTNRASNIRFSYNDGDLVSARYLWTTKNVKNTTWVYTDHYGRYHRLNRTGDTGWDHKETTTDATTWKVDYKETMIQMAFNGHQTRVTTVLRSKAEADLARKRGQIIVDAKIQDNTKYEYNKDYFIGDVVFLDGDYGARSAMRVTEVARILDESGEKCFPTLKQASPFASADTDPS